MFGIYINQINRSWRFPQRRLDITENTSDAGFRQRIKDDATAAIADFRLTDEERQALLAGEVGKLESMGAHGYVLGALARHQVFGLDQQKYIERMHG